MKQYICHKSYFALKNSLLDSINISEIETSSTHTVSSAYINTGGWQSWSPGFEVLPEKKSPSLFCKIINQWNKYLVFPGTDYKQNKRFVYGQFISYLRWDNHYLVFASTGNCKKTLPPVQFIFDRKNNCVQIELSDINTYWNENDIQCEVEIFTADSFFQVKDKLSEIFGCNHFKQIENLGTTPSGWESWYNHYSNINETVILKDLNALKSTENVIANGNFSSRIFQIDDGWEQNLGDWDIDLIKFPEGMKKLISNVKERKYIPGLWIAPFIIDSRSHTAVEHPDWLLKNKKGQLISAGYNPLWGKNGTFYCLNLEKQEVLDYLDNLFNKIINEWGIRYLKLDFLYAGMISAPFSQVTPSYKLYKNAITTITSRKKNNNGEEIYYLGCGVPFELSFTSLPLSRIGCDTYEHWENKLLKLINWNGRNSAYLNLKDTLGHALWNKTVFYNDPDVIFIRNENCSLTYEEKLLIAKVNIMFGSQFMYSDDPDSYNSEEERKLTREILEFKESVKDEEFGIKQISKDKYEFFSKSGKNSGYIDLGQRHKIYFNKQE